ncbi:MAG: O-antigen ligase family protein [candidate division KSB1 bacterium]|nr:O-antigen ligase family protein [candidate division KSB1 bacterium]MDQ7066355.1 O-antigen ligase family protein [candidate division KSB1 bacterium]
MSLRVLVAVVFLILGCVWTLRRPFIGVLLVILYFHMNLRALGAGLEDIRFQYYATLVLVASYVINKKQLDAIPSPTQLPMKLLFGFLAMCFITSAWAVADSALAFESSVDFAKIVLFSFLMSKIVKTEKELRILIWVILGSIWYAAFMARWGEQWGWISENEIGIATGGTGTHFMIFFPTLILMAIWGSKWEKRAAYFILPFVLDSLTVLPEGSRASFLNLVLTMIAFLFLAPKQVRRKSMLPFAIGAVIFIFVLAPPGYFDYMRTILEPSQESSAASRSIINQASMQILMEYPHGIGYNNYSLISMNYMPEEVLTEFGTRDAHNSYFKVATEFGIVGFLIWMSVFIATWIYFRRVRKTLKKDQLPSYLQLYAFSLSAGLIGVSFGAYTHNYNDLDSFYWLVAMSCILYNLQFISKNKQAAEAPAAVPPTALPGQAPVPQSGTGKLIGIDDKITDIPD